MFLSGFTIARNAIQYDYPVVESIRSILPIVDEMVVAVGESSDGTRELIQGIGSPKIRIIDTVWDETLRSGGQILAQQTNVALDECRGDWCFYLQADEVIHENDLDRIQFQMRRCLHRRSIEGLRFSYHHFRADYRIRDPLPYRRQIRVVRPGIGVRSIGDACGFGIGDRKLTAASTGAWVYHYGYVKPPSQMAAKLNYFVSLYGVESNLSAAEIEGREYARSLTACEEFRGTHPNVMSERIARKNWETPAVKLMPRWRNPKFWQGLTYKNTRSIRRILSPLARSA